MESFEPDIEDSEINKGKFSLAEESEMDFMSELFKEIFEKLNSRRSQFLDEKNILAFKHGRKWSGYTQTSETSTVRWKSDFKKQTAETSISWKRFVDADFSAIDELKNDLIEKISSNFESSFFETIIEATADRPSIQMNLNGDIRKTILEMWDSLSVGLNEDLSLSAPSLALDPETFEKFATKAKELAESDPNFQEQINAIKKKKWIKALIGHFDNILKFNLHEDERGNIVRQLRQLREIEASDLHAKGRDDDPGEPIEA